MKHNFHVVDIYVLDVHTTVKPLIIKNCMKEGLEFLVDEELYRKQHKSRLTIQKGPFKIKPLTYDSRQYNHFWKNYMSMWPERRDFWKLQIPFTCEATEPMLVAKAANDDFQITVRPIIYISSVGWSTNIALQLTGNMKLEQIRGILNRLRSKDENGLIFELEGDRANLSGVFKYFSSKVRETLYKPLGPTPATLDTTSLHRHFIVSLTNFTGSIYYYKNKWWNQGERMTNADQALLHSILHGRPIDMKEFAYLTRANKFSVVHFTGPDLALSYFDLGTLVFLQQAAIKTSRKTSMVCLGSNIRSCSMMTLMFLYFHSQGRKFAGSNPALEELVLNIGNNLARMPEKYTNQFCKKLFNNHSDLNRLRSDLERRDINKS